MNTPADPAPPIQQPPEREATSPGQGKILLRRLIEEVINQGNPGVIDELFSPPTGPWLGAEPTGRRLAQVGEIAILRVQDNRSTRYWVLEDNAARTQQLDITTTRQELGPGARPHIPARHPLAGTTRPRPSQPSPPGRPVRATVGEPSIWYRQMANAGTTEHARIAADMVANLVTRVPAQCPRRSG